MTRPWHADDVGETSKLLCHTVRVSTTPQLVAFDLDDTLAPSKSPIDPRMAELLTRLLQITEVCIISGGQFGQFKTQVIDELHAPDELLGRLHLMPTCGTQYWRYVGDTPHESFWFQQYNEELDPDEKKAAIHAVQEEAKRLGFWETETWGPIIEDRGSQITFSALGQEAPVDAKRAWDPTGEKKNALREAVQKLLPTLEVRSGGSTSVDITRMGIDKAYGMTRLAAMTDIAIDDMLFIGDRLDPDGNDYPVKVMGVPTRAVKNWQETAEVIEGLLADHSA